MRPMLKPALRRLWRDAATVQLGVDPERAVVLSGVDGAAAAVLGLLDGSRDRAGVLAAAAAAGVQPESAAGLLDLLADAGALDDGATDPGALAPLARAERDRIAPDLAAVSLLRPHPGAALDVLDRRRAAAAWVVGGGRIGVPVATLLAASGVGQVGVETAGRVDAADTVPGGWQLADVGAPASEAARAAVRRIAPTTQYGPVPAGGRPDVVVLAGPAAGDPGRRLHLLQAGLPHLAVTVREVTGVVTTLHRASVNARSVGRAPVIFTTGSKPRHSNISTRRSRSRSTSATSGLDIVRRRPARAPAVDVASASRAICRCSRSFQCTRSTSRASSSSISLWSKCTACASKSLGSPAVA